MQSLTFPCKQGYHLSLKRASLEELGQGASDGSMPSDEILNLADRAKQAYQLLADVNRDITNLAQEIPKSVK
jgi:hypothetical protein